MSKREIHFIGFLANVDDSIAKLKLGQPFSIGKKSQQDVIPFLRHIDMHWGVEESLDFSAVQKQGDILVRGQSFYCITARNVTSFEGTPQGGVLGKRAEVKRIAGAIRDKIRLLRLFREGNIVLRFSFFYHIKDSEPSVVMLRDEPFADRTKFRLEDNDISEAQSFIQNVKIPFAQSFLQLAFESFELSYEVDNAGLAFLSLMISLETMLNPADRELRYRVSRNAAVLLGRNAEESERIFSEVRVLYDKRSKLVHTGESRSISQEDVLKLRGYVREGIKEINVTGESKDELLGTLNACGFGQRPWRGKGK